MSKVPQILFTLRNITTSVCLVIINPTGTQNNITYTNAFNSPIVADETKMKYVKCFHHADKLKLLFVTIQSIAIHIKENFCKNQNGTQDHTLIDGIVTKEDKRH